MTCNNLHDPLGLGLWEGVPLRDVIWQAKPDRNIRRLFYRGYHNDNPKQIFQSSLPIGRVLEDPPGELPVILCYKMNGKPLTGERGGPVRMIVPDAYGFKSVKWIQQIFLTNLHGANDTYAEKNNDVDSQMKSFARFITKPKIARVGKSIPLTGAQGRQAPAGRRSVLHQCAVEGCGDPAASGSLGHVSRWQTATDPEPGWQGREIPRMASAQYAGALGRAATCPPGGQIRDPLPGG